MSQSPGQIIERTTTIGTSIPRIDGAAKVSGRALYVDDIPRQPGELFGVTVRSPVPRGRIRSIVFDPSFDWNDITVVTAGDVPVNIVAIIVDDQPVLAKGEIRHAYEPVVLLAGADRQKLERAMHAVKLDIEPLPAVLSMEDALNKTAVIYGQDNVMKHYLITKGAADIAEQGAEKRYAESKKAIDEALSRCEVVVSGRYSTHHAEQLYIEPQGMIAEWKGGELHVQGSLQCPYYVHKALVRAFDLPGSHIHVTQNVTGGGFGGKEEYPSVVALHAALLAKKSGKPVRMIYGRREDIEATTKRHPSQCDITTGCDRDGKLRVLDMRVLMDAGAYVTLTPVVLSRGTLHASGAYLWEHARIESMALATNTPPNGAYRGFGAPQTIWAIEKHLDRIARELGRDPLDLRKQNALRVGDTTATGQVLRSSVAAHTCIERAMEESAYAEKRASLPKTTGRIARGIGASVFMHGAGFTGSGERYLKAKAAVDLLPGGRLQIRTASTDIGQGTETVFRQIAADAAGLPLERVDFAVPCTTHVPDSGPTVASRTVMVVGSLVEAGAREIAARVRAEQEARGLSFEEAADGLLAREQNLSALKQFELPEWVQWNDATYKGDAYPCFAWACDIAEVEVDLDTFEVNVVGFWSAVDVGKAINPLMCKGQIEGGTLQALGWALSEEIVWQNGLIRNARMTNYIIPTALDAPPFQTEIVEDPFPVGPGGAKGIGELPLDGGAPAIAAAIEHATGLSLADLPLTPEHLLEAAKRQGTAQHTGRTR